MDGFPRIPDAELRGTLLVRESAPPPLTPSRIASVWDPVLPELEELVSGRLPITLVVNDGTRPPSHPLLAPLGRLLTGRVRVLFATGTHRAVTPGEKEELLGGLFPGAPWESSDCDSGEMVLLGTTSGGTPVKVHPWVVSAGAVLSVNSVEPHYFAGYTGGRKSFLPGVSSRESVVANHFLACSAGSAPGCLEGNPVHLDMMEALALLEARTRILQCNGVVHRGHPVHAKAGSCTESFMDAVRVCSDLSTVRPERRSAVVVVHPGEPLDVSLYQSEKAIYNCHHIVEDGGVILLVSPCREGLGAPHLREAFLASMEPDRPAPTRETYRLGDHAVLRLREMRRRIRLALASDLPRDLVTSMGIEPVGDPAAWLDHQRCAEPLFLPDAGTLVPVLGG